MNKKEITDLAREAAKTIKTEQDLNDFSRMLKKITVETALNAELDAHLGYDRHQDSDNPNSRNGYSSKTLLTEDGAFEVDIPRDRDSSFEPQLVKKHQRRFTTMDEKILCLYAKGMTTREIVATFKEMYDADVSPALISKLVGVSHVRMMYDADVSPALISKVTDAVLEQVIEWQSRPLDAVYPIVYLDCIVVSRPTVR